MARNNGRRVKLADAILSDDEFEELQRAHFGRRHDEASSQRAKKSLYSCLNAISALRDITGLKPVTLATADDCAAFQKTALDMPKNWRHNYPKGKKDVETISPNTVLKWSRSLQAAFDRANRNAGKKCVRGVVTESKLLSKNPWHEFTWIEGTDRQIRQFDDDELLSFLKYLDSDWSGIDVASLAAKLFLWSWGRRMEVTSLKWSDLPQIGDE